MNKDRLFLITELVIALSGFITLAFHAGLAIALLGLAVVLLLIWFYWSAKQPQFTVISLEKELDFHDKNGDRATLVRTQSAIANHKGQTEFWIRNISSDGSIENILVDGNPPDSKSLEAGDTRVCKRFARPLQRGERFAVKVSYDLLNAFPKRTESLIHVVGYKTKKVRLTVRFHAERVGRSPRAWLRFGGEADKALATPEIHENGRVVSVRIDTPKRGAEYCMEWDW